MTSPLLLTVFTGDTGSGKSQVVAEALRRAPEKLRVLNPGLDVLRAEDAADQLERMLGPNARGGRERSKPLSGMLALRDLPVLIVDAADELDRKELARLFELAGFDTPEAARFKVVLVWPKNLPARFDRKVAELLGPSVRLKPMSQTDSAAFIGWVLTDLGQTPDRIPSATRTAMYSAAGGLPGAMRRLCCELLDETPEGPILPEHVTAHTGQTLPKPDVPAAAPKPVGSPPVAALFGGGGAPKASGAAPAPGPQRPGAGLDRLVDFVGPDRVLSRGPAPKPVVTEPTPVSVEVQPSQQEDPRPETVVPQTEPTVVPQTEPTVDAIAKPGISGMRAVALTGGSLVAGFVLGLLVMPYVMPQQTAAVAVTASQNAAPEVTPLSDPDLTRAAVPVKSAPPETPVSTSDRVRVALAGGQSDPEARYRAAIALAAADPTAASAAFALAAEQGHTRAAYYLGQIYEVGEGVPANAALARSWYELAAPAMPLAAARLASIPQDAPAPASDDAPRVLYSGTDDAGWLELVWTAETLGTGPFRVELADESGDALIASADLTRPVARMPYPEEAAQWRIAGAGAATDWMPLPPRAVTK